MSVTPRPFSDDPLRRVLERRPALPCPGVAEAVEELLSCGDLVVVETPTPLEAAERRCRRCGERSEIAPETAGS